MSIHFISIYKVIMQV